MVYTVYGHRGVITIGAPNIVRKGEAHGIALGRLAEEP